MTFLIDIKYIIYIKIQKTILQQIKNNNIIIKKLN